LEISKRLVGKTAVVTAAAQGIGRAVAERFLAEGADVYASDLNGDLVATLEGAHPDKLDATDPAAVTSYFNRLERIDVLVHAVGYVHQGTIEECSFDDWKRSCSITLDSAFHVLGAGIPKMKEHGGSIITIGSLASSIKGFPRRAAYSATKGGVLGLTKAMAADYIGNGIRVNSVCPGTVDTPSLQERIDELAETFGDRAKAVKFFTDRQPAGRFGAPEEIAAICAFLACDDGAFVNGQAINVDGGATI
jgi:2-keto-3-deoxy-L-fuconate dehydrogenase